MSRCPQCLSDIPLVEQYRAFLRPISLLPRVQCPACLEIHTYEKKTLKGVIAISVLFGLLLAAVHKTTLHSLLWSLLVLVAWAFLFLPAYYHFQPVARPPGDSSGPRPAKKPRLWVVK